MDEYVLSYGYVPTGNWILIVHEDDTTEYYTFEDQKDMWCCRLKEVVGATLDAEARACAGERGLSLIVLAMF